jgi:glutaredoxin 3
MEWLDAKGIPYELLDVIRNAEARAEMFELTGQTKAPSVEVDGEVLADFGADELELWWQRSGFEA